MASRKEYLEYILDQLSLPEDVSCRAMMGEYILYYRGRIVGGIYDDRLLVKQTPASLARLPGAARERPYESAGEMLLVDEVDDGAFLRELLEAMYEELQEPKKRKRTERK